MLAPRPPSAPQQSPTLSGITVTASRSTRYHTSRLGGGAERTKKSVRAQLAQLTDVGQRLLAQGAIRDGLGELSKAVVLRAANKAQLEKTLPLWSAAEEYVLLANAAAVHGAAAAESLEDVQHCFQEALRFLLTASPEDQELLGTVSEDTSSAGGKRLVSAVKASPVPPARPWQRQPDYFAGFPELRQVLRGLVLNNIAVQVQLTNAPTAQVLRLLQRALTESRGVLCTWTLYNVAVTYMGSGRFEEATEAIARCVELAAIYCALRDTGSLGEGESASQDGYREGDHTLPSPHPYSPARETLVTLGATHTVLCHHLLASLAAWCGMRKVELYQCELAQACALAYLSHNHPLRRRCETRLAAAAAAVMQLSADAHHGEDADIEQCAAYLQEAGTSAPPPPHLPLLAQAELLPSQPDLTHHHATTSTATGQRTLATVLASSSFVPGPTVYDGTPTPSTLPVSALLALCVAMPVPTELQRYLRRLERRTSRVGSTARPPLKWSLTGPQKASAEAPAADGRGRPTTPSRVAGGKTVSLPPVPPTQPRKSVAGGAGGPPGGRGGGGASRFARTHPPPGPTSPNDAKDSKKKKLQRVVGAVEGGNADGEDEPRSSSPQTAGGEKDRLPPLSSSSRRGSGAAASEAVTTATNTAAPPRLVTALPRVALERYKRLKRLALDYVREADHRDPDDSKNGEGREDGSPAAQGESGPRLVSVQLRPSSGADMRVASSSPAAPARAMVTAEGTLATPTRFMQDMDAELLRFSQLVVDSEAELREFAIRKLQRQWRIYSAQLTKHRRAAAVRRRQLEDEAACRIQQAYAAWKARQRARCEVAAMVKANDDVQHVTVVQQFVRQQLSGQQCEERLSLYCVALRELQRERFRRGYAAKTVQRWWRDVQAVRREDAALHIQTVWRGYQGRVALRRRRASVAAARDRELRGQVLKIIFLQRWWRACLAYNAVQGVKEARQAAVAAHLAVQELAYNENMGRYQSIPGTESAARTIMAVLRGAHSRQELRERHVHLLVLRRALTSWALRVRGRHLFRQLRVEREERRRLQRRREEVEAACVVIQSVARGWLTRQAFQIQQEQRAQRRDAARVIQRAYRRHRLKAFVMLYRAQRDAAEAARQVAQRRVHSAELIQATWRMHRTRCEYGAYMQFMLRDRHVLARRIQRAWRVYHSKRLAEQRRELQASWDAQWQLQQLTTCAATRIQSVARTFLVRCALQLQGVELPPTPYRRRDAARRIQTVWRGVLARRWVHRLGLAAAFLQQERASQEALHTYATMIQSVVRGRILNPRIVAEQRARELGLFYEEQSASALTAGAHPQLPRHVVHVPATTAQASTQTITTMPVRSCGGTRSSPYGTSRHVASPRADGSGGGKQSRVLLFAHRNYKEEEEEEGEGAPRDQALRDSFASSSSATPSALGSASTVPPVVTTGAGAAVHSASDGALQTSVSGSHEQSAMEGQIAAGASREVASTPNQPTGSERTEEEETAALCIQRVWRGYRVRREWEVFYEEYEEEVSASASFSSDDGDGEENEVEEHDATRANG